MFEVLYTGLDSFFGVNQILMTSLGVFFGIVLGVLPGVGPLMGVIILTPVAFYLEPVSGMGLLIGIFVGGSCGGAISAVLLRIPGTPIAAATLFDGYPMAQKGQAPAAVGLAISASSIGGLLGGVVLVLFCPLLAKVAMNFTPPELFALAFTGLISIAVVSGGSPAKGLMSGCLGLLIATMGLDPFISEFDRFTFGMPNLLGGINLVAILVGLFALSEAMIQIEKGREELDASVTIKTFRPPVVYSIVTVFKYWGNLLRSSIIGTFIGALPGAGSAIAAFVSYAAAKGSDKDPARYGTGVPEGVIATEAANNACCGGALIPALALAIPGDATTAVLLSAMIMLGAFPGPTLFRDYPAMAGGIFLAYIASNFILFILGIIFTPFFVSILKLKKNRLIPLILLISAIGTFALQGSIFDLQMMMLFGLVGYILRKNRFPLAPIIIARVLGPLVEDNFRRSLILSDHGMDIFWTRPISATILTINFLLLLWAFIPKALWKRVLRVLIGR
jgi:putative tricarboxylic transport membrane protein